MTTSNDEPSQTSDTASLRREGRRLTLQRRVILHILEESPEHLAPEAIYQRLNASFPEISRATVYRTLEMLEESGLLQHTHAGPGGNLYHLNRQAHLHLLCNVCGAIVQADDVSLADTLRAGIKTRYGFIADPTHFAIGGICGRCAVGESAGG
ncbi:MAG TPA: Fur family transcriptional regulator [Chloroflexota bacterium]|nr:Fur family transcriptional regulator [Chloroflexota bacterium]